MWLFGRPKYKWIRYVWGFWFQVKTTGELYIFLELYMSGEASIDEESSDIHIHTHTHTT